MAELAGWPEERAGQRGITVHAAITQWAAELDYLFELGEEADCWLTRVFARLPRSGNVPWWQLVGTQVLLARR